MSGISSTAAFSSEYLHPVFREHFESHKEGIPRKVADVGASDKTTDRQQSNNDLSEQSHSRDMRDTQKANATRSQTLSSNLSQSPSKSEVETIVRHRPELSSEIDQRYSSKSVKSVEAESTARVNVEV